MLNSKAIDVVGVHDLFNAFVVVKNGEAWHFIEVFQMAVETVAALNEVVSSVHQSVTLHTCILHSTSHALAVSFLGPIRALIVVKRLGG